MQPTPFPSAVDYALMRIRSIDEQVRKLQAERVGLQKRLKELGYEHSQQKDRFDKQRPVLS